MPPTKPEVRVNGPLMPHVPQAEPGAPEITSGSIATARASATFEVTKAAVLKASQATAAVQQASVAATIAASEANRLMKIEAALIAAGYTEAQINQVATEGVQGIMELAAALLGK